MAKDQSFDVVSQVDLQEADNAVQQTMKEITQRYDLKDTGSTITLDKARRTSRPAPSDFVLRQVIDVLYTKLVRREIDLKAVSWGTSSRAGGSRPLRGDHRQRHRGRARTAHQQGHPRREAK